MSRRTKCTHVLQGVSSLLSFAALVGEYTVVEGGQNPWLGWMEIYALDSLTPREQLLLLGIVSCPSFARPLSDHGAIALELHVG